MKVLLVGAGKMGGAIALDLAANPAVEAVTVADREVAFAEDVCRRLPRGIGRAVPIDCNDAGAAGALIAGHTVTIGAADYRYNEMLARKSLEAGSHFCDLGGNNTVVNRELALNGAARKAGVTIIPDCGLAPGLASLLVADGVRHFDHVERVAIRVGGLPVHPTGPLKYQLVFSVRGLTNEYLEPAVVLREGRIQTVASLTEVEELEFPAPFGVLEAFQTSGGTSTLPATYRDQIRELDYKTIRYPGHCERVRLLQRLGLLSEEVLELGGGRFTPREVTEAALVRTLPHSGADVVLVRVTLEGTVSNRRKRRSYQCIEYGEESRGLTAMMRMTAFPASIIAQMLGAGAVTARGAVPQELAVPAEAFVAELRKRGITIEETSEELRVL